MKKIWLLLLLCSCLALSAGEWILKNLDGGKSVLTGKDGKLCVVKAERAGAFELIGKNGLAVEPGTDYILDFQCRTAKCENAYVNFYLLTVDKNGKKRMGASLSATPGERGLMRNRTSRLETVSGHYLTHRIRFKTGKNTVKVIPVYESSDGKVELYPGEIKLFKANDSNRATVEFSLPAAQQKWGTFKLMPQVQYKLDTNRDITGELQFISQKKKVLQTVPFKGSSVCFRVPALAVETELTIKSAHAGISGKIVKNFVFDRERGIHENEWQGTELLRGEAVGEKVMFRHEFDLPAVPEHGAIRFFGHNNATLYVNGKECGSGEQFYPGVANITPYLRAGKNVLALEVHNSGGQLRVIFDAYIKGRGYERFLMSGKDTRYAWGLTDDSWRRPDFDSAAWRPAVLGGSPKDFGDSIVAARVNSGHKRLSINAETQMASPLKISADAKVPEFEVIRKDGKAVLTRNGVPVSATMFCHGKWKNVEIGTMNYAAGIKLHMINTGQLERDKNGNFDFTVVDTAVKMAVEQIADDPDAHIIVAINFEPDKKFGRKGAYKDELTRTSKGKYLLRTFRSGEKKFGIPVDDLNQKVSRKSRYSVSHASKLKIADYTETVRALVRHLENSPYVSKIAGYGFSGELDGQWHLYAPYSGAGVAYGMADYSGAMLKYFREYLQKKYGSDQALQKAWSEPAATIAGAELPGFEERIGNEFFVSRKAADYAEAFALAEYELLAALGNSAKSELKRKTLLWVYSKDSFRDVGLNQFFPQTLNSGSGFEQYSTDAFNAIGNPTDYYFRRNGLHPANRGAQASAHLNKKLRLAEMDLRSYLTQAQQKVYGGDTAWETVNHFRNVLFDTLQHGGTYRFYGFWPGWYNNAAVQECMNELSEIAKIQVNQVPRWKKQICLIYDDRAITHIGNFDSNGDRLRFYYFAKSVTATGADLTNVCGAGTDVYYLRDILNPEFPADQYKIYIFSGAFQFNKELISAVNSKLRRNGNVLIFPWGSGFLNSSHQVDGNAVTALTGIKVKPHRIAPADGTVTNTGARHELTRNWAADAVLNNRNRYNMIKKLPNFVADDPEAVVLGRFADQSNALAVKKVGDSYSIYCAAPSISPELLRSICKAQKVHVYTDKSYDIVASDGNFLGIHSAAGGVKTVRLPEKVLRAVDWFTGEVLAENSDTLKINLRDDETVIMQLFYGK